MYFVPLKPTQWLIMIDPILFPIPSETKKSTVALRPVQDPNVRVTDMNIGHTSLRIVSSYGGWLRNPAPVNRWFIPIFMVFQPSKVMQDFATIHSMPSCKHVGFLAYNQQQRDLSPMTNNFFWPLVRNMCSTKSDRFLLKLWVLSFTNIWTHSMP